ncbi:type VI secretion system baseplate subunit TssF [soil metagenome]
MLPTINNSKELIKSRMLKHALNYWNIKNGEDLDPIVKLILEALSSELYNLSNEIKDTEVRILEKISNLLAPDFLTCPNTSHALMVAQPIEPYETLEGTDHFFTTRKISTKKDDTLDSTIEIYFTPVNNVSLADVKVVSLATGGSLYLYDDNNNKLQAAHNNNKSYSDTNVLWIGLDSDEKVPGINNVSFCFDWKNPDPKLGQLNYQLLPLGKWYIKNKEVAIKTGITYKTKAPGIEEDQNIFIDYNLLSLMENDIKHYYDHKFITIEDGPSKDINELKAFFPEELRSQFTEGDLKKLNKKLLWIKVVFPVALPQESLDEVQVLTNCFPVMNRQLNDLKYRLRGGSNIIPLKTDGQDQFLAVKMLSDESHQYQSTPYRKTEEEIVGTFTLRSGGVERFDVRNAKEFISYLLELLRSESSAFAVYGYDFIATILREMNQRIALMEQKTKSLAATTSEIPHYIIAKPFEGFEMMYVDYWTTLAEGANNIRSGTKFQQLKSSKIKEKSLCLLTTSIGGKNRLKPEERLNAFRYGLITRNRIVTKEDIRNFCHYELGSRINNIAVTKGIEMSVHPQQGFSRTIDIAITPSKSDKLDEKEWNLLCDQLKSKLEMRSGMSNNYRILLQN